MERNRVPLSSTHQFYTKGPLFFSPQNLSVPHQKPQFHTKNPQFWTDSSTHRQKLCWTEGFLVWNWGECETEGFFVWNWGLLLLNWGILVLNWGVFGVELRDFWCWKGVVLVWNRCVELRGSRWNWGVLNESGKYYCNDTVFQSLYFSKIVSVAVIRKSFFQVFLPSFYYESVGEIKKY